MPRRMPGEVDRQTTPPVEGHEQRYIVRIFGQVLGEGAGHTEDEAHRIAEETYDRQRAALVREGEDIGREALIEKVAQVLYAYHHSTVVNHGRGLSPGTPLPAVAPESTMNHFRREAQLWLLKVEQWGGAGEMERSDTANARGMARGGAFA